MDRRGQVTMMAKKSVEDVKELKGKKVLVRCDLNCPLDGKTITDDTRIRASVPTLKYLLEKGAKVAACSHLGRPKDGPEDKFSLGPCAERMGEYLPDSNCKLAPDCVGDEVTKMVNDMSEGELIILENTRFYKEETKNDEKFAEKFAKPFDLFVNDAFGTAHRAHASTEGVTKSPEAVSGFLLKKELDYLNGAIKNGEKPLAAIVGGSKVSSKITVLTSLIEKCNKVFIGGGMVFTFLKAKGMATGSSLVEDDFLETAKEAMALAEKKGCELILPSDIVVADKFAADAKTQVVSADEIPDGWMGPMGVFEMEAFAKGTNDVAKTLAEITKDGACTIIGGGDSVAAVEQAGLADQMSHISTGGGASLELLEGKVLPGVAALAEA